MNEQRLGALPTSHDEPTVVGHTPHRNYALNSSRQYKILVIEDDPLLQDAIAVWLGLAGYTVVVAHDGHEGLVELSKERPDLVITDVVMPGLNGIEMIRSIRQFRSGLSSVPILVLTGSFIEYGSEAISAGADRALAKPVDPEVLLAHVRYLLNQSAAAFRSAS
jgi:DNA-binding response OmpR family regulator